MKGSIRAKIIVFFTFIIIILSFIGIWSILNLNRLSDSIENIMKENYQSVVSAQLMTVALERQDSAELASIFSSDVSGNLFVVNQNEFLKAFSKAEDNITEKDEPSILNELNEIYADYINEYYILKDISESKGIEEASKYYYTDILPLFENAKQLTRDLFSVNQEAMLSKRNDALVIAKNASFSTALISSFAVFLGLIFSLYLISKTVRPINTLIEKIKLIAQGDYKQQLQEKGNDEIAILSKEFNHMANRLKIFEEMNIQTLMEEKKKAEGIVESIGDVILVTDNENCILTLNRAAEKTFDVRKEEVIKTHFLETIKNEEIFEQIKNTLKNNKNNYKDYTDISISKNDSTKYFRVKSKLIKNERKEIIGVVTLMQDITKLKEVDSMKSEFVSTVSHEFRTPLTSIRMSVNLLLDGTTGNTNDEQKELLNAIKEDQERLTSLVDDLLDLSRIEMGKIKMDIQPNHLKEIVKNAVGPFSLQLKEINASIKMNLPENLPKVKADFNKITWVLTNLIGNAIRYIPKDGSGLIEISANKTINKILVSVSDNGPGILEDMQEKIFDKFVRYDQKKGGTGLGLAISREILQAHGREIWVKSIPGKGSTFYFTLNYIG